MWSNKDCESPPVDWPYLFQVVLKGCNVGDGRDTEERDGRTTEAD